MSYKRFSLKSPYGANGEGKERVNAEGGPRSGPADPKN